MSHSHTSLPLNPAALGSDRTTFILTDAGSNCSLVVHSGAQETANIITNYRETGDLLELAHVRTSPLLSLLVHSCAPVPPPPPHTHPPSQMIPVPTPPTFTLFLALILSLCQLPLTLHPPPPIRDTAIWAGSAPAQHGLARPGS